MLSVVSCLLFVVGLLRTAYCELPTGKKGAEGAEGSEVAEVRHLRWKTAIIHCPVCPWPFPATEGLRFLR